MKMPRKGLYKKTYNQEKLQEAILACQSGTMAVTKAAFHYGIPRSTLSDHVSGKIRPRSKDLIPKLKENDTNLHDKKKSYKRENLQEAILACKSRKVAVTEAAFHYDIPRSTLSNHVSGKNKQKEDFSPQLKENVSVQVLEDINVARHYWVTGNNSEKIWRYEPGLTEDNCQRTWINTGFSEDPRDRIENLEFGFAEDPRDRIENLASVITIKEESDEEEIETIEISPDEIMESECDYLPKVNEIHSCECAENREKTQQTNESRDSTDQTPENIDKPDQAKQEEVLLEPYTYIMQIPGKQVRMKLAMAFNHWLHIPDDKLHIIIEVSQMLHNASLLIDDIEDSSELRRGIPVAHHIYGVAHTINSANYVYFLGLEKALTLNHSDVTKVFTEQVLELHRGQGMDIYWRDSYVCPTEEEYKDMVIRKTGGLFGLGVRLMQLFSSNQSNLKPLLDNLGLYFQIRDDYANLYSEEYEANKSYGEDLTEGKFSFPIIHGIRSSPDNNQVMSILRQRTRDLQVKKYCVEHLSKIGSFEYTRKTLVDLENRLKSQIAELGGNPHLAGLISELRKIYTGSH